jgi:hypothetical protein
MVFVRLSLVTADAYSVGHGITVHGRNVCAANTRKARKEGDRHVPKRAASSRINVSIDSWDEFLSDRKLSHSPEAHIAQSDPAR